MKNKRIESIYRAIRKQPLRSWRVDPTGFCEIYHCYDPPKKLSWWDDTAFRVNKKRVVVTWIHPRLHYSDTCENIIYDDFKAPTPMTSWINDSTPVWKKVGKSRKKIVAYRCGGISDKEKTYFEERQARIKVLETEGEVSVKPFLKFEIWDHAINMSICMPIEVLNEKDVLELAKKCKYYYLNREEFAKDFGDYVYTKDNWNAENI